MRHVKIYKNVTEVHENKAAAGVFSSYVQVKKDDGEGYLLAFGTASDGDETYSTAIVERSGGVVDEVYVGLIEFTEPTEDAI